MRYDLLYPTFRPAGQARNRLGCKLCRRSFCGNAPFVKTRIRLAINGYPQNAAASRRTISITTGFGNSVAVAAPVAYTFTFLPGFRSLTRATAYWLVVRHGGGVWWSTAPGKRQGLRSKTLIGCPIPPTAPKFAGLNWPGPLRSQRLPFCVRPHPTSLIG